MKRLIFALVAALLVAGQFLTPVVAAATLQSTCGDTYVVRRGDYLSKIARYCGVSVYDLIVANPQITNPNRIYPGQVIRITPGADIPVTSNSTYVVQYGDTLFKIAMRFGTTVYQLLLLNPQITNPSLIFAGQVIYLPDGSGNYPPPTNYGARVSLSTTSVLAGGTVKVSVSGFPANTQIDYRVNKSGQAYSTVVDGTTNSSGAGSATITIPSSAVTGEIWYVVVQTTELPVNRSVTVRSAAIRVR